METDDSESKAAKPYRILSLDGGGAKGFYSLGVLREIEGMLGQPLHESFDLVFGTSTGAIIAALIALGYSVEDSFAQFKKEVIQQLKAKFADNVKPGNKAIFVKGSGNRRDCDVLACAELRRYTRFKSWSDQHHHAGICFWTADGTRIINFPKQHSANCTSKHQNTNSWFKPSVRILKNMRNSMIEKGYLKEGVAPSYCLEGMLYNVPNEKFGKAYEDTIANALNWIISCDRSELVCANELYYLCHATSPVTWRAEKLQTYLDAAVKFWKEW